MSAARLPKVRVKTRIGEARVAAYLVADTAFRLTAFCQKCFADDVAITADQERFNRCVIRTRRYAQWQLFNHDLTSQVISVPVRMRF
jgi:hypothetical protein